METEVLVFTSVEVALRGRVHIEGLWHVQQSINDYVAIVSRFALQNVLTQDKIHLFHRTLRAVDKSRNLLPQEKMRQYRHAMALVAERVSLQDGQLEMLQELYKRYPGAVDKKTLEAAAKRAEMSVLQWLYARRPRVLFIKKFAGIEVEIFKAASRKGQDAIVHWLVGLFPDKSWELTKAAKGGHLDMIKWLVENANVAEKSINEGFDAAVKAGHLDVAQFLFGMSAFNHKPPTQYYLRVNTDQAAAGGHLEVLKFLHEKKLDWYEDGKTMSLAAANGHLQVVKWMHELDPLPGSTKVMDAAAKNGHLEVVQWLHETRYKCTTAAIDNAAMNGHVEVMQWLHDNRREGCSTDAMDLAAQNGHLNVMRWLHANRSEGCTKMAMQHAVKRSDLKMVKWLHKYRKQKFTGDVKEVAASGNLKLLKWLHDKDNGKWSASTMDTAAANGHLAVVKFLHKNHDEGCTKNAMIGAARENHFEIVRWLCSNTKRRCTAKAMDYAAKSGNLQMVKWFKEKGTKCTPSAMLWAAENGHVEVMKFLEATYSLEWPTRCIHTAMKNEKVEAMKWLHFHLNQPLDSSFAVHAARNDHIAVLEFMRENSSNANDSSIKRMGYANGCPEVALWYKDHFMNHKRKRE